MERPKSKIFLLGGITISLLAAYLLYTRNSESNDEQGLTIILVLLAIVLIIFGNYTATRILDRIFPWNQYKDKRFALQVILGLIISLSIINFLYIFLKQYFTDTPPLIEQIIVINIYGAAIIIPIISIFFGVKFLRAWDVSQLETERLQKENARSQMMSLRNHLDPHFLFNNLNILSSLMDHDIQLSKSYLDKFAEVYRTILRSELSDLSTLSDELQLIESYIYLIKIRWQGAINIQVDITKDDLDKAIPPLAGQMLIENVIKHNAISKDAPVSIYIKSAGENYLEIANSKKPKIYASSSTSGTGLINIQNRYAFFTDRKVKIRDDNNKFSVLLPLLKIEKD